MGISLSDSTVDAGRGLRHLRYTLVDAVQLHLTINDAAGSRLDAHKQAPLAVAAHLVVDNLDPLGEALVAIEQLGRWALPLDGPVKDLWELRG